MSFKDYSDENPISAILLAYSVGCTVKDFNAMLDNPCCVVRIYPDDIVKLGFLQGVRA